MRKVLKDKKILHGALTLVLTFAVSMSIAQVDIKGFLYRSSILSYPEHEPFDGTVYPVVKVPDWSNLATEKWKVAYDELSDSDLVEIPYYDPDQLDTPKEDLKWGDAEDNKIRNAKITYSVPYLGNYLLDGKEYGGSHPGIDIKIPVKTPIQAIANGVVVKAVNQASGFGYHIVLMHNNFPTLEDASAKEVVYSSYSHLSELQVEVGDVVRKGEQIALSGASGTATTPHLHFQIDNDDAPWHPFWPFTYKEASDAGFDFFSAINNGLGQELAKKTTINAMKYVQDYLDAELSEEEEVVEETVNEEEVKEDTKEERVEEEVSEDEVVEDEETIDEVDDSVSSEENLFSDVRASNEYYDAITYLVDADIIKGYPDGSFRPDQTVNRVEALKFILEATKSELKSGAAPFKDTKDDEWYSNYLFTAYSRNVVNGDPDGAFRPTDTVNRAEFFKILFNGMNVDINPTVEVRPYEDVETTDWHAPFIAYAKELGLLDSERETIKPSSGMSRGEVAQSMYRLMKLKES